MWAALNRVAQDEFRSRPKQMLAILRRDPAVAKALEDEKASGG